MPPKRKAEPIKASPSPPAKRGRKASPTSPASPSPRPKTRGTGRTGLPFKPSALINSTATNTRASRRIAAARSSSPEPPFSPPTKAASPTIRVTRSSSPAPLKEPSDLEAGEVLEWSRLILPNVPSLDLEQLQLRAREYEKRITDLEKLNTKLVVKDKEMGTNLNMLRQQTRADMKQHRADAATINMFQADIKEKNATIEQLRTKIVKLTDKNQPEDFDRDKSDNISDVSETRVWKRVDELVTVLRDERKKNEKFEAQLAAANNRVEELKTELENAEERIDIGVEELRDADRELHECREKLTSVEARWEQTVQELKNVDGVAKELVACQKDLKRVNGALAKERKSAKQMKEELEKAKRSEKEAKRIAMSKQEDVDNGIREIRELEANLEEKTKQISSLEEKFARLDEIETELAEKNKPLEALEKEAKWFTEEIGVCQRRSDHFEEAANAHLKLRKDMEKMHKVAMGELAKMRNRPQVMREQKEEGRSGRIGFELDWNKAKE